MTARTRIDAEVRDRLLAARAGRQKQLDATRENVRALLAEQVSIATHITSLQVTIVMMQEDLSEIEGRLADINARLRQA